MIKYPLAKLNREGLPPLLNKEASIEQWESRRKEIAAAWLDYRGEIPERVPTDVKILSETQEKDHIRIHLTYASGFGDRVPAYLLIPEEADHAHAKLPAILALHPTHASGKGDIASPEGRAERAYGIELVRRGFVVLAPDVISAGERIAAGKEAYQTAPFYEEYPRSTAIGRMLHDHQQGLDVLQQLPYVDGNRIGAIGHSLGAYNSVFLAGCDARVKAVVSSCGLSSFTGDSDPNRWGQRDWFSHIPRLSEDINQGGVPFEWHEIFALCAPTPLFNWIGQNDHIFPHWKEIAESSLELDKLYRLLQSRDKYIGLIGNDGHDFPEEIRQLAYQFLEKWLV